MNSELNVLALVLDASLPVKLVLGILVGFSVASWFIIFRKKALVDRANASADEFEERFWSGADLAGLFKDITGSGDRVTGSGAITTMPAGEKNSETSSAPSGQAILTSASTKDSP